MRIPRVKNGHPRLWIAPCELNAFIRRSRGAGRPLRTALIQALDKVISGPDARAAFTLQQTGYDPAGLALALGAAWRMTRDARYADAAAWLLEDLELWEEGHGNYDVWGIIAETAACLYDWLHDHWCRTGREQDVAAFTALCGRRALDDLLHRYILEDWHNYSLGLQSGALAAAVALGRDHPRIEDGTLLAVMAAWHFTGYRDTSIRLQDFHRLPPLTRSLDAGLRADGGTGFACLQEAAGGYHVIDAWEVVKMAEFWSRGTTAGARTGGCVWPELNRAGEAIIQTMRPDGCSLFFGDGGSHGPWSLQGRVLSALYARNPEPAFAWFMRKWGGRMHEQFPVFPLLHTRPSAAPAEPSPSAQAGPLVCMRSGWGADAVMVTFRCGRHGGWHNHMDHNSFTIYCGAPLAIDSGGGHYATAHRPNYASRTVAHNTILVKDLSEKSWPGRRGAPVVNDGGQRLVTLSYDPPNKTTGGPHAPLTAQRQKQLADEFSMGRTIGFKTRPDLDYTAGDAAAAYTYPWSGIGTNPSRRVEEAVRQVVFLKPDLIVIFDRVEATRSAFPKTWLLHSIGTPTWKTQGRRRVARPGVTMGPPDGPYAIEHSRGRLTVWPLLPAKRKVRVIGGKGYEWWVEGAPDADRSGGRNFPPSHGGDETGCWRIEVSPARLQKRDCFLTVLHAGLKRRKQAWDRYAFSVTSSNGETRLAITETAAAREPIVLRFGEQGRVSLKVTGMEKAFRHSAPAPKRIAGKS